MHICMVNDYSIEHIGGAVASMFEQKKALEQAGHKVSILQLGRPLSNSSFDLTDVTFIQPDLVLPRLFYNLPLLRGNQKNRQYLRNILDDLSVDVLHLQSEVTLARLAQSVGAEIGIPSVMTVHTFFWTYKDYFGSALVTKLSTNLLSWFMQLPIIPAQPTGNVIEKALKNLTLSAAQQTKAVISPSSHQRDDMQKAGLTTPVSVIPNPFQPDHQRPPQIIQNTDRPLQLLWIGRCVIEKRPLEFLEGVTLARQQLSQPFTVTFIGDGSALPTMKKYADEKTIFLGKKTHAETIAAIDDADITVLSSYHYDNQPMTIAESISHYRPVLYCDERLTEGLQTAGYRTENPSAQAFAAAIVDLVNNRSKVVGMSRNAQAESRLFAPETFLKSTEAVYQQVLERTST